ncbi:MAG: hypothetical protein ACFFD2_19360 [Promethearchaeota archaeon]
MPSASPFNHARIAIYCRVSSHDQKKNGDLTRQIVTAQEFCRNRHIEAG